jgi:hypothetical protein
VSVEQAQHQMSEPAGNSQHGRSAFAAQGRGKEAASVAFDGSGILVALTNTANYVLFASYMMHATYCIAYYVHCSVAGPTKTQRAQSSSKVLVSLSIDCQMHGNIACGSHRNACSGIRSHTTCRRLRAHWSVRDYSSVEVSRDFVARVPFQIRFRIRMHEFLALLPQCIM